MAILVIDLEPKYRAYWQQQSADTVATFEAALALIDSRPKYDRIIVSSCLLDCIPELIRLGHRVEVATAMPTTKEAVRAYWLGASDYFVKSF